MFPNNSSSYDISSKTNAFVQINEEGNGSVREMAQSHVSIVSAIQVPDERDVKVVVKGEVESGDPSLTVITNHPSPAPAKIPTAQVCERESDGSSIKPRAERQNTGALCFVINKSSSSNKDNNTISVKESDNFKDKLSPSQSSTLSNIPEETNDDGDDEDLKSFKICDYYSRWGIPRCFKLLGGGESSLTTGTAGWGTPPTSQSGSTGWNGGSSGSTNNGGSGASQQGSQGTQQWNNNANGGSNPSGGVGSARQGQQQSGPQQAQQSASQQGQGSGGPAQQQQQGGPTSQNQASGTPTSQPQGSAGSNTSSSSGNQNNSNAGGAGGSSSTNNTQPNSQTAQNAQSQSSGQPNQGGQGGPQTGPTTSQGTSWAAAAGKGLPQTQPQGASQPASAGTSTKQQMEQINTMREALYSQDGWGGQNVNQDSNWDIPGSPEPGSKESSNSNPRTELNSWISGTDLWEANLRNGGIPPPQTQPQKPPWGPSNNIGGTWGEDDEGDGSNVWTGVPHTATGGSAPQWPNQPAPIWTGGNKKEGEWSGPNNWTDQRDPREIRPHGDMRQMIDPREHMRATTMDHSHKGMPGNDVLIRGDTHGITGRLNGSTTDGMWSGGPAGPHHHLGGPHHQGKLPNQPNQPGVTQWPGGGPPLKEMGGHSGKPNSGWEEPSPPAQRRNMPNYDDGTSLWGSQHPRPSLPDVDLIAGQNKVSHWKEMPAPMGRGGLQCPPNRNPNMKPDQPLWATHPPRNGAWNDSMDVSGVGGSWVDEKPAPWIDQPAWQSGPKHKPSWDGEDQSWAHPSKQTPKQLSKEMIWGTKQFRILTEMGFKKEEVENALRASNMSLEDALEFLNAARNSLGDWQQRRHTDLDPDHSLVNPYHPSPSLCLPFPTSSRTQQAQQPSSQQIKMLVHQIQMAVQAGYLNQQILNQPLAPQTLISLNQLLQHIKVLHQLSQQHTVMQVSPLSKTSNSSHLLQLSVQITKTKQSIANLQNQIAAHQANYAKQQQQQQQLAASQNDFFKGHDPLTAINSNFPDLAIKDTPVTTGASQQSRLNQWKLPDKESEISSGTEFSRAPGSTAKPTPGNSSPNINPLLGQPDRTWSSVNRNDCETGWPESSGEENSSKDWPTSSQTSSQAFSDLVPEFEPGKPWKGNPLKSIEDDPSMTPGSVVRSPLSLPSIKDSHILSGSGAPTAAGKTSPTTTSPLDIMPIPPLSLSSSTWTFNPPSSTSSSGLGKLTGNNGPGSTSNPKGNTNGAGNNSGWGDSSQTATGGGELWGLPKSRGPPPGLAAKPQTTTPQQQQNNNVPTSNGWSSLTSARWSTNQPNTWGSTWLLLRNLTPQIDGSTLKTLCVQHGPLQNFHLYLNHGIALAKYATREEANKAQGALNNCVLGNTTIFAESPGESDVHTLLQHLGGQGASGGSGGGGWRTSKEPTWGPSPASNSSNQLWPGASPSVSALWPDSSDQHRNTPSSLNSFLPENLLGGESM